MCWIASCSEQTRSVFFWRKNSPSSTTWTNTDRLALAMAIRIGEINETNLHESDRLDLSKSVATIVFDWILFSTPSENAHVHGSNAGFWPSTLCISIQISRSEVCEIHLEAIGTDTLDNTTGHRLWWVLILPANNSNRTKIDFIWFLCAEQQIWNNILCALGAHRQVNIYFTRFCACLFIFVGADWRFHSKSSNQNRWRRKTKAVTEYEKKEWVRDLESPCAISWLRKRRTCCFVAAVTVATFDFAVYEHWTTSKWSAKIHESHRLFDASNNTIWFRLNK